MRCKDIPKFGLLIFQGLKYQVLRKMIFFPPISALKFVIFKPNLYLCWSLTLRQRFPVIEYRHFHLVVIEKKEKDIQFLSFLLQRRQGGCSWRSCQVVLPLGNKPVLSAINDLPGMQIFSKAKLNHPSHSLIKNFRCWIMSQSGKSATLTSKIT